MPDYAGCMPSTLALHEADLMEATLSAVRLGFPRLRSQEPSPQGVVPG